MSLDAGFQGSLFANDFLCDSVTETGIGAPIDDAALDDLEAALRTIFDDFPIGGSPNESQTENDLIWPVLARLGWTASLQQQNLSATGREDVPDGLLFADMATKDRANRFAQDCKRYGLGLAVVESKRWRRPLDRRSGQHGERDRRHPPRCCAICARSTISQPAISAGAFSPTAHGGGSTIRGARSVSEQFFEVDLAAVLDLPGYNGRSLRSHRTGSAPLARSSPLAFRRDAFLPSSTVNLEWAPWGGQFQAADLTGLRGCSSSTRVGLR